MQYEFACPMHGYFEIRMTIAEMERKDKGDEFGRNQVCPQCMNECERLVSVPKIEPDPYWSGQGEYKNLAEKKAFDRNHFSPTRSNMEQVQRNKATLARAREKRRHDTVADIVRNIDNP